MENSVHRFADSMFLCLASAMAGAAPGRAELEKPGGIVRTIDINLE